MGVTVTCPAKRVDLRMDGLCESTTSLMIATELERVGGVLAIDVSVRLPTSGGAQYYSSAYASVPTAAASVLLEVGVVVVEWVRARMVLLPKRRIICVRCLNPGHLGSRCPKFRDRKETVRGRKRSSDSHVRGHQRERHVVESIYLQRARPTAQTVA